LELYPSTLATQVLARVQHADVIISNKVVLDAETLKQCSSLKLILISATGAEGTFKAVLSTKDITDVYKTAVDATTKVAMDALTPDGSVTTWANPWNMNDVTGKTDQVIKYDATGKGSYYEFKLHIRAEEKVEILNNQIKVIVNSVGDGTGFITAWPQVNATGETTGTLVGVDIARYFTDLKSLNLYLASLQTKYVDTDLTLAGGTYDKTKGEVAISSTTGTDVEKYATLKVIVNTGKPIYSRASNAARVAFFDSPASVITTYKCTVEPNSAKGFNAGKLQNDYYDYINGTNTVVDAEAMTTLKTDANNMINDATSFLTINAGTTSVITVRVWLEGTDGDCFNAILSDKLSIELAFTASAKKA
ncbi:MAG: hypothetical protein RR316_00775, partial [Clostridia bacterium]